MAAIADVWGDNVAAALDNHLHVIGWGTQDINGGLILQDTFGTAKIGTHVSAAGALDLKSRTVSFNGHGTPSVTGNCKGACSHRIYTADTFSFIPGEKYIANGVDTDLDTLATFYTSSTVVWYDYYGQKGTVRPLYAVQFNAYTQRKQGS